MTEPVKTIIEILAVAAFVTVVVLATHVLPVVGVIVAAFMFVGSVIIVKDGWDGWRQQQRGEVPK